MTIKKMDLSKLSTGKVVGDKDKKIDVRKAFSGVSVPRIISANRTLENDIRIETGTGLDELFVGKDIKKIGFPVTDTYIFAGLPNTGKSYLAANLCRKTAEQLNGKVLWIAMEPKGVKKAPDYREHPDLFDVVYPSRLDELAKFINTEGDGVVGSKYRAIIIDSISEPREDALFMPKGSSSMLKPLRERSIFIREIKGKIRQWLTENERGDRGDFIVIIISHLKKITRPDSARLEEVLLPIYKAGKLQSGYTLSGVVSDMMQYLASYTLIFVDYTAQVFKVDEGEVRDVPTLIRVYPHKSRETSRYKYKTFRITDDGVVA